MILLLLAHWAISHRMAYCAIHVRFNYLFIIDYMCANSVIIIGYDNCGVCSDAGYLSCSYCMTGFYLFNGACLNEPASAPAGYYIAANASQSTDAVYAECLSASK